MNQAGEAWTVIYNTPIICGVIAWAIAQTLKVVIHILRYHTVDFSRLVGAGGMPSSHTSFCVAITATVGFRMGFTSAVFAVAAMVTVIVMSDAAGVRHAAGQQAKVLNEIVSMLHSGEKLTQVKLRELLGHTRLEVLAGFILGAAVAVVGNLVS